MRSAALGTLARLIPRRPAPGVPDWAAGRYRVLYVMNEQVGDAVLLTAVFRAIARAQPTVELHVLAAPAKAPVLARGPHVRTVLVFDRRRPRSLPGVMWRLWRGRYDAVVDRVGLRSRVRNVDVLLLLATGARYRIGVLGQRNDFVYSVPLPTPDPRAHFLRQSLATAAPFGVDPDGADPRPALFLGAEERGVVAAADVVLTSDTAISHTGAVFDKPMVVLTSPAEGGLFAPHNGRGHFLTSPDAELASLPAEPVAEALEDVVRQTVRPSSVPSLRA